MRRNAVVLVTDHNLLPPARYIWSRLAQLNPRNDTDIILVSPVQERTRLPSQRSLPIDEIGLPSLTFTGRGHISAASYYRLAVPRALSAQYAQLLYVDIDTLVTTSDLFRVFDIPRHGFSVAAVRDLGVNFSPEWYFEGQCHDGEFVFARYLNSGVMLIDVDQFLAEEVDSAAFDAFSKYGSARLPYQDQTALNLVLQGRWAELSPAMNMHPSLVGTEIGRRFKPMVIHYYGPMKPWHMPAIYYSLAERRAMLRGLFAAGELPFLRRNLKLWNVIRHRAKVILTSRPDHLLPQFEFANSENSRLQEYLNTTHFLDVGMVDE